LNTLIRLVSKKKFELSLVFIFYFRSLKFYYFCHLKLRYLIKTINRERSDINFDRKKTVRQSSSCNSKEYSAPTSKPKEIKLTRELSEIEFRTHKIFAKRDLSNKKETKPNQNPSQPIFIGW